ncbi:uncharacterized protein FYW47_011227 [Aplochiton taeniatus]
MSADIRLFDLVNQSIGSPEIGAVNFNALHSLLHAIIGHLKIQNVTTNWREEDAPPNEQPSPHTRSPLREVSSPYQHIEDKLRDIETQIAVIEKLPSGTDLLDRTSSSTTPVNDMWQLMQIRRKVQTNEDGVSKTMALIQDLLKEIQDLRESRDNLMKQVKHLQKSLKEIGELSDRVVAVENCCHRVENLEAAMEIMDAGNLSGFDSAGMTRPSSTPPTASPLSRTSPTIPSPLSRTSPARKASPNADAYTGGATPNLAPSKALQEEPRPRNITSEDALQEVSWPLSRVASGAERYPKTVEALKNIGRLKERHDNLEARVGLLEAGKVDQAQLLHLQELITDMGDRDLPDNLVAQLNHLQSVLDSLMADRNKSSGLMNDVQAAIQQLQAECEKLHSTTDLLVEEHSQKQTHIDHLYKSMEKLEEKKADKEIVEMEIDIKADKRALDSKVSRMQFDSMTEQLNAMFQELLSKITGQEQDWHNVIEKISTEMECKLNRIELDPLKKQLEDRWSNIRKKLQAQPAPEQDDAAGFRKQLVARFHCISCDRPVDMQTPGPHLVTMPSAPGLPSHKSNRPYTVYELEQVRQHCRSERIPEMADYSYLAMSRSCGGSHTVTYPNRRLTRLQHITHIIQTEEDVQPLSPSTLRVQPEEVDILGLDGHIYKGRVNSRAVRNMEARLPNISPKDGMCKSKDKVVRSQSQKSTCVESGRGTPVRPQSAKTPRSRSASASSIQDRPSSSAGSLPQHPLPVDASEEVQPAELQVDPEEEPVTSL